MKHSKLALAALILATVTATMTAQASDQSEGSTKNKPYVTANGSVIHQINVAATTLSADELQAWSGLRFGDEPVAVAKYSYHTVDLAKVKTELTTAELCQWAGYCE